MNGVRSGFLWIYEPSLLGVLGLWWALRRWRDPVDRYVLVLVPVGVAAFDAYLFQAARFMAGPASVLVVLRCVQLAALFQAALVALSECSGAVLRNADRAVHVGAEPGD